LGEDDPEGVPEEAGPALLLHGKEAAADSLGGKEKDSFLQEILFMDRKGLEGHV
jgi:hypothetical protein